MSVRTVLYVEDEEFDVVFMRKAFERLGLKHELKVAVDGQEAIDYLAGNGQYSDRRQHPLPALVVLDLNLPIISGFEVLQWLRRQAAFRSLPVVVLSSSVRREDQTRAGELGASEYQQKPSSGSELPTLIEQILTHWLPPPA